jgi:hypothetical protein
LVSGPAGNRTRLPAVRRRLPRLHGPLRLVAPYSAASKGRVSRAAFRPNATGPLPGVTVPGYRVPETRLRSRHRHDHVTLQWGCPESNGGGFHPGSSRQLPHTLVSSGGHSCGPPARPIPKRPATTSRRAEQRKPVPSPGPAVVGCRRYTAADRPGYAARLGLDTATSGERLVERFHFHTAFAGINPAAAKLTRTDTDERKRTAYSLLSNSRNAITCDLR